MSSTEFNEVDLSKSLKPLSVAKLCTFSLIPAKFHFAPKQLLREASQYLVFNFTANVGAEKMPLKPMPGMGRLTNVSRQSTTNWIYNRAMMIQTTLVLE